jgi:hypothetical protein
LESSCELGNEPSGSIKFWESTEWLHNLWPLVRYSALQSLLVSYFKQLPLSPMTSDTRIEIINKLQRPTVMDITGKLQDAANIFKSVQRRVY